MRTSLLLSAVFALAPGAGALDLDRSPDWEQRMLEAVNGERDERGLPRYRADRDLEAAAADHARRMAATGRLAHQLPGEPPLRLRIAATGLRFDAAGENVGYSTRAADLHDNLMRSASHRDNLLSTKYDSIGIAIYQSGARYYVTQDFARTTSRATALEAVDELAAAVAELRRRQGLPNATVERSSGLRDAACAMARRDDVDASPVPLEPEQRHRLAFTTFEPGELTGEAREAATDPDARRITVGVCHRSTRRYPAGVFWFALAY